MVTANNDSGEGPVYLRIRDALTEQFQPQHLVIEDESHKHAGHAAMRGNDAAETHFAVTVVSQRFDQLSVIDRHRLVNEALAREMDSS